MRCREILTHYQYIAKKMPIITKIFFLYFSEEYYKPEVMSSQNPQTVLIQCTLLDLHGINCPKQKSDLSPLPNVAAMDDELNFYSLRALMN
jgi:hypothetical protein